MADISVSQKPRGQFTWIWATLAILAIAALMYWLSQQEGTTSTMAAAGADTAAVDSAAAGAAGAQTVELPTLAATPDAYTGQTVSLRGVNVAASLGPRAFWADVPGQNPFLVVVDQSANAPAPASGQTLNLEGTVNTVDEATVAQWTQQGALNPGAEGEASFATHYLLANQVSQ